MVEGKINRSAAMRPDGARIKSFSAILAGSGGTGESVLENGELPGRHLLSHSGLRNREGASGEREGGAAGVGPAENGGSKTRSSVKQSDPRFDVLIVSCSRREKVEQKEKPSARWF